MSHTTQTGAVILNLARLDDSVYTADTGCLPLSFTKNKSQIRASRLLYYRAYDERSALFLKQRSACTLVSITRSL